MQTQKLFSSLAITLCCLTFDAKAQMADTASTTNDTLWKKGAITNLNFSQVALKNWTGGGQNSVSGTGVVNLFANYRKEKLEWKNSLDMAYGLLSQRKEPFIKNDDRIQLRSKLGRKLHKDLFYSGEIEARSQFAPGYQFPEKDSVKISGPLAPAYIKGALGVSYNPNEHFNLTASPAASKVTLVNDERLAAKGAYGVNPGDKLRYEFGGDLSAAFNKIILPNTRLKTELGLFTNYLEEPGNIDVNFSLLLNMKVNSFITASISTNMIYDDDIMVPVDTDDDGVADKRGPRLQLKEVLNIGISFEFGNKGGQDA